MLAPERQQQILTLLKERGSVRTIDLSEEFQVTDETIRRDLQILADNQQLSRIHGGASSINGRPKLQSFTERRLIEVEKKRVIAKAALERIQPGQTYAFDSSTSGFALVTLLPDLPYRVLTNAYAVLDQLVSMEQIELISTGGSYHPKTQTFISGDSYGMLRRHNINCAFVSCIGLDVIAALPKASNSKPCSKRRLYKWRRQSFYLWIQQNLTEIRSIFSQACVISPRSLQTAVRTLNS
jgi:DeoR/GlpR family transcriptional regulator of sugar metabolism